MDISDRLISHIKFKELKLKHIKFIIFLLVIISGQVFSQTQFQEFIQHLYQLPTVEEKNTAIDSFMTYARTVGIPFVEVKRQILFIVAVVQVPQLLVILMDGHQQIQK